MLRYLIVLLDDTSISYCHYSNKKVRRCLLPLEDLKRGILFAMKENLMVQFVYPEYELPQEYVEIIETVEHCKIVPWNSGVRADVCVVNSLLDFEKLELQVDSIYVLRISKSELFTGYRNLFPILRKPIRLNIVITDIEIFSKHDILVYKNLLEEVGKVIKETYVNDKNVQVNLLTDRLVLEKMNNCNAGWENITLAPDGRFYVCPAFYQEQLYNIGDLKKGLDIKNPQLYKLAYAPICRKCDAWQCKRCIWLNRKMTFEVNIPSHEQCVVAHIERNVSRELLLSMQQDHFLINKKIREIGYLDPFDTLMSQEDRMSKNNEKYL